MQIHLLQPFFSLDVNTNIGSTSLKLLKQHFLKSYRLHKVFSKNKLEVSCSYMNNMSSIISSQSKRLLKPRTTQYGCNCQRRKNCPLQNQCLTLNIIYRADVGNNSNKGTKIYCNLAETPKILTMNSTEKEKNYKNACGLKEEQRMSRIRWSIVEKSYGQTKINLYPLYLAKKLHLIEHFIDNRLLNKRNEFTGRRRHHFNKMSSIKFYKTGFLCL